eukprot:2531783-Pleurochrysis_carterae.AAC.1
MADEAAVPDVLRIAVIGTGCIGQEHIRTTTILKSVRVVALADPYPPSLEAANLILKQASEHHDVLLVSDYQELLKLPQAGYIPVLGRRLAPNALARLAPMK